MVEHRYSVALDPASPTLAYKKLESQFSRYDRIKKTYEYVSVSEEQGRSVDAGCDSFLNGGLSRQMSKDANRVAWRSNGHLFVRDVSSQRTLKVKPPSTIYKWTLSGNGEFLVFTSDVAPDGKVYLNKSGGRVTQIYRYGPITSNDFGSEFSLSAFERKVLGQ